MEIIAQAIGFVGLGMNVLTFQLKDRARLLLFSMTVSVLMSIHFFLLGAYTAAALFVMSIFRAVLFRKFTTKDRPLWPPILIIILFLCAGILTWHGIISILPLISTFFVTIGLWQLDTQRTRQFVVVGPLLWIVHNIAVGSIAGVINECISLTALVSALLRHARSTKIATETESTP